jgi:hypothetical protein
MIDLSGEFALGERAGYPPPPQHPASAMEHTIKKGCFGKRRENVFVL